ncbi:uncharacterized protein (TIGR03086 family) [Herbihabitans rhizosphaerae]|uniref:Uncharacterized protein (TIGR03086 family) n=1 Tax=Herbihabitans rhizosphaerae TaxID=1872711 RepID=A0A4Q7L3E2_9PSEU|nr:TIGR03086 family metal-binding protein [Herbihabitans rhizosphaerae]RZS43755.1 uncharacterized protein (TIGR03086 family) [Herbihabitans rhizosphaerae]
MTDDPRPALSTAIDHVERIVFATQAAAFDVPTPCTEYDARTLIAHLDAVLRRIAIVFTGGDVSTAPTVTSGVPDDGWAERWKDSRAELETVLAGDAVLDGTVTVPWGIVPATSALGSYCTELATHAWDLARAIGRPDLLDDSVAAHCLPVAMQYLPAAIREDEGVPFGPVVAVSDDAPAFDRLAAWMGRDPKWVAA